MYHEHENTADGAVSGFYPSSTLYILYAISYFSVQPGEGLDIIITGSCKVSSITKHILVALPEICFLYLKCKTRQRDSKTEIMRF
jgi:hypothetical protein